MSKPPYYKTLSGPQTFVLWMFLFLVLTGLIAAIINEQILRNFENNRPLNSLIIGVLIFGILFTFQQVLRLYPEVRWVNNFRISDPGLAMDHVPVMLAPMAMMRSPMRVRLRFDRAFGGLSNGASGQVLSLPLWHELTLFFG